MGFLLVLLSFVVADEVVKLEPVNAGTDVFNCNQIGNSQSSCNANPYCHFLNGNTPPCVDDPCFSGAQPAGLSSCPNALDGAVSCEVKTVLAAYVNGDCTKGTGTFCGSTSNQGTYDYCFWANLRDNKCPDSVCVKLSDNQCTPTYTTECQKLSTKTECGLVPKCVWHSTSANAGTCMQDPCFVGSEAKSCGEAFVGGGWIETNPTSRQPWQTRLDGTDLQPEDCVLFEPYKSGGGATTYCVYKENTAPNKCYFLKTNTSTGDSHYNTDYGITYPTYSVSPSKTPECTAAISACDSHESAQCITKWNPTGGLAGQYCGEKDAPQGGGALTMRSPSLAFLLASALLFLLTW